MSRVSCVLLIDQYVSGPDIQPDYEARLLQLRSSSEGGQGAAVMFALVQEYMARVSEELKFSPSVSANLLQHSHLVSYGGAYYSYLFAKMHAAQIWQNRFAEDPLCRWVTASW